MKKLVALFMVFMIITIFILPIHLFAFKKVGQAGLKFLDIGVGARPSAMGEAFGVVGNDAYALFYNPAGIAQMNSKWSITGSITYWISDVKYNAFGVAVNAGLWGNFGISVISPDYGEIIGTEVAETEQGYNELGNIYTNALAGGVTYARQLTDKFYIGGQILYAFQHLGSSLMPITTITGDIIGSERKANEASGLVYSFGTIFYPKFEWFESFGISSYVRNFSTEFRFHEGEFLEEEEEQLGGIPFQLPLTLAFGIAGDILDFFGEHPDNSLIIAIDVIHPRDYSERLHFGAEYTYKNMITGRLGYKFNYDEEGITLGVGFKYMGIGLDYSYGDFGVFDMINRVSVCLAF